MSCNPVIIANNLSKCFHLYAQPADRLKQFLWRGKRQFYREFWALKDINFSVNSGEVIGVIGRNGAGKSTLLQLLCGTLNPSHGSISVNGRIAALLELGAGFNPEFSGRENVFMSAAIMGLKQSDIVQRFDEIVEFSGVADFIDHPVKTYSSGMYVRLAFSIAISVDPDILIIDEALSVGDGAFSRKSFDRIMALKKAGKTIFFCSHSIYQVEAICDRAIWLDKGEIIMLDEASKVTSEYCQTLIEKPDNNSTTDQHTQIAPPSLNGTAHITSIKACVDGVYGNSLKIISEKSSVTVAIQIDFDPDLPTPSVAITISTINGLGISSASSFHDNINLSTYLAKDKQIEVHFPNIPLLKGDYTMSVYLGCENALHFYDSAVDIIQLHVERKNSVPGFVMLPHQWSSGSRNT